MSQDLFWLTDAQFSKIRQLLPTDTRGKARVDDRRVISGIIHVLASGGRWIDAPPEYGPKKTLYNRYVRWAAKGVWAVLFQTLAQAGGPSIRALLETAVAKKQPQTSNEQKKADRRRSSRRRGRPPRDPSA